MQFRTNKYLMPMFQIIRELQRRKLKQSPTIWSRQTAVFHGSYKSAKQIYSKSGATLCTITPTTKWRKDVAMDRRERRSVPKDKKGNTTNNRDETFQEKPTNEKCVWCKPWRIGSSTSAEDWWKFRVEILDNLRTKILYYWTRTTDSCVGHRNF